MTKRSWVQTPTEETIFSGTIHLDQKPGAKIEWKFTWHCNPEKERLDFEDGWLIKSSF